MTSQPTREDLAAGRATGITWDFRNHCWVPIPKPSAEEARYGRAMRKEARTQR